MSSVHEYWQSKSDEEVVEAAQQIDKYTRDGQARIQAEITKRGIDIEEALEELKSAKAVKSRSSSGVATDHARAFSNRYRDAYLQAAMTVGISRLIKGVGMVLGLLTAVLGLLTGKGPGFLGGLLSGAMIVAIFYFIGIGVATMGQALMATLDSAVNTSPFLDDSQKAEVMRLN